jgi:hypothetical protein
MSATAAVSNARMHFEQTIRKMGPGYAATINGISNPIRVQQAVQNVAPTETSVRYRHVIDTWA